MIKAKIKMPGGGSIEIEGNKTEVEGIVNFIQKKENKLNERENKPKQNKKTATNILRELKAQFFNKSRSLPEIKNELAKEGYHYPLTTLSAVMLRLTKKREFARIKVGKKWGYVKR